MWPIADADSGIVDLSGRAFVQHGYSEAERFYVDRMNLSLNAISHVTEGVLFLICREAISVLSMHFAEIWEKRGEIRPIHVSEAAKKRRLRPLPA